MYYVYFLKSLKNNDLYIGSCENIDKRFNAHQKGKVRSTKPYRPWKLVDFEPCPTRSVAVQKERFYKTGQQKALLKIKYN